MEHYIEDGSNGDRNKTLLIKGYLDEIKPYLKDLINNLQKSETWKTQLTMSCNFISSKDIDEEYVMHLKSDNIEILTHDKIEEVIKELFKLLLSRYQIDLKTSMKSSDFIFGCVVLQMSSRNLNRVGSCTDSPDWIQNKKARINAVNNDNKCFQ